MALEAAITNLATRQQLEEIAAQLDVHRQDMAAQLHQVVLLMQPLQQVCPRIERLKRPSLRFTLRASR